MIAREFAVLPRLDVCFVYDFGLFLFIFLCVLSYLLRDNHILSLLGKYNPFKLVLGAHLRKLNQIKEIRLFP